MKKISLNGNWRMTGNDFDLFGKVPGSVYSFLLENGKIDDPYYRDNELQALKLMDYNYTFCYDFDFNLQDNEKVFLCFDGLDTLASISLNGINIASTDNMHRSYKFCVSEILAEKNTLAIEFSSPTEFIKVQDEMHHLGGSYESMKGFPHLRKAHCMFGWDWGPRLPDMGIFKDVYLLIENSAYIKDVYFKQRHENGKVFITPQIEIQGQAQLVVEAICPLGTKQLLLPNCENEIKSPQLWWPNGFGEQPLYTIKISLFEDNEMVDYQEKRIGLRSMSVIREADEYGEKFAHIVNGIEFFAFGADYVPEDNILSRLSYERTYALLKSCKDCNFNVVRVWGGGFYPFDYFYDICDELGLVVWQDLMFACANYLPTEHFKENITAEIIDNVVRIRHHACLGLWCGNNEMEMFALEYNYEGDEKTKKDYFEIFENVIPPIVKKYDPNTFYWPASPSSGGKFDDPNCENRGDTHYWDVWHGNKPFCEYRKFFFRYASEFGFQSFPEMKTVESFTQPQDQNIFSRVFEMHQRNGSANGKIMNYLASTFMYPTDFDTLLYASQMLQAYAIKYGVEHFRRNRGRCMGAVYWQLNDIWPTASWSSIDYFHRYKALHYFAKRFFAPILISCEEIGETTYRNAVSEQPTPIKTIARLNISNETLQDVNGTVYWQLRNNQGKILKQNSFETNIKKLSAKWFDSIDFDCTNYKQNYFSYQFVVEGKVVSEDCVLFTTPKHFEFLKPNISAKIVGDEIEISSDVFAYGVRISAESDCVFSDNYFNINAETKKIKILSGTPKELIIKTVYDIR